MQVGFSNLALVTLAVSLQTMVRSAMPVCVLLISFCFGLRAVELRLVLIVVVVSAGTALITAGVRADAEFAWAGFFWIVVSMLCGGSRLCLSQVLLQNAKPPVEKLTLLYHMLPICSLALVPFFLVLEYEAVSLHFREVDDAAGLACKLVGVVVLWAALGLTLVYVELTLIGMTSSLTFSICATCKELMLVGLATVINGDRLSPKNLFGFGVSLSGVLAYKYIMYQERQQKQQAELEARRARGLAGGGDESEAEVEMMKLLDSFDDTDADRASPFDEDDDADEEGRRYG